MNKAVDAQFIIWRDRAEAAEAENERLTGENRSMNGTLASDAIMIFERDQEIERLTAAIAYVRQRSARACEILNEFDNSRRALENKP